MISTEPSSEVIEAVARAIEAARHNYEPQDWEPSERDLKVARAAIAAHTSALERAKRNYSVLEIEKMRLAVRILLSWPSDAGLVEEQLRTYMLNGTDPEELLDVADARFQQAQEAALVQSKEL